MKPELKAFRYYKKNIDHYLELLKPVWGDNNEQDKIYKSVTDMFGADLESFKKVYQISYERSIERAFR